uniref:Uncharacterized protein n=1 Tax=viral metagenome TaxID=1070528 RepID=A0A6C0K2P6_9ZZZZ
MDFQKILPDVPPEALIETDIITVRPVYARGEVLEFYKEFLLNILCNRIEFFSQKKTFL